MVVLFAVILIELVSPIFKKSILDGCEEACFRFKSLGR